MKTLAFFMVFSILMTCADDPLLKQGEFVLANPTNTSNSLENAIKSLLSKEKELQLSGIIQSKTIYKEGDFYELDFTYPYLEGENNWIFNNYITENQLNLDAIVNQILDDKEIQCTTSKYYCGKDKKKLKFNVHLLTDRLLSVILYQENHYYGTAHSTYKFECLNFLLNQNTFLKFNDVFKENSEDFIRHKLNNIITNNINDGIMHQECWTVSKADFSTYKDNFVMNENAITYYFDDCIMCPAYTGSFSVEIPIEDIIFQLNFYQDSSVILTQNL